MQNKYDLSKRRSMLQMRSQRRYLNVVNFMHKYTAALFGLFILKMFFDNLNTSTSHQQYRSIVAVKAVGYALFFIAFQSCALSFFVNLYEFILGANYLRHRLNDLSDELFELTTDEGLAENGLYVKQTMLRIARNYNSVLGFQQAIERHVSSTLKFVFAAMLFTVIYPALVLFESDKKQLIVYFYCMNYLSLVLLFGLVIIFTSTFYSAVSL